MEENLISVITPCLNGEKLIHRFLESLLNQTYKKFELIFVDDGSKDKTKEVLFSYKQKFKNNKINLIYIYKENAGLAAAINTGLKEVNGEYFCWPDSDDYLEPTSLEKRINILKSNKDCAVVTSDAFVRDINNLTSFISLASKKNIDKFKENQFELLLSGNSMFIPGTHMVRTKSFFETNPKGEIFPCRRGQNWQLLMPLYFKYKRFYLDEPLYNYIVYDTSMSKGDNTLEKKMFRANEHEEIILRTLESMTMDKRSYKKYIFDTKIRYTRKRLTIAFLHRNNSMISKEYHTLKVNNQKRKKEFIYYIISKNVIIHRLFLNIISFVR